MNRHSIRNLLHISGVWGSNFSYQLELQYKIQEMTSSTQLVLGISTNSIVLKLNNKGNKRQNVLHNKIITISPSKKKVCKTNMYKFDCYNTCRYIYVCISRGTWLTPRGQGLSSNYWAFSWFKTFTRARCIISRANCVQQKIINKPSEQPMQMAKSWHTYLLLFTYFSGNSPTHTRTQSKSF